MTTIAWDGVELVGDRRSIWGGTRTTVRKVFRVVAPNGRAAVIGFSGKAAFAPAYLHWLAGGERPSFTRESFRWHILLIDDQRNIYVRSDECDYWDRISGLRRIAIGSGADYALGAMYCGRTAREAVRIACQLDHASGDGIDVVRC